MSEKQKRQVKIRSKIEINKNALAKYFGRLANGSHIQTYPEIIHTIQECVYVVRGMEKRPLTDREASQFIKDGTITVK